MLSHQSLGLNRSGGLNTSNYSNYTAYVQYFRTLTYLDLGLYYDTNQDRYAHCVHDPVAQFPSSHQGPPTTCIEINECLETNNACGVPALQNICTDKINSYECKCGLESNFTGRGLAPNPCLDLDVAKPNSNNCTWVRNLTDAPPAGAYAGEYDCSCDVGYVEANHVETKHEYCADEDDCVASRFIPPEFATIPGATACGRSENICTDRYRNHTCSCAHGYYLTLNSFTNRPVCLDIDECALQPSVCGPSGRDGLVSPTNHQCTNTPGGYQCSCAAGYRKNSPVCEANRTRNGTDYPFGNVTPGWVRRMLFEHGVIDAEDADEDAADRLLSVLERPRAKTLVPGHADWFSAPIRRLLATTSAPAPSTVVSAASPSAPVPPQPRTTIHSEFEILMWMAPSLTPAQLRATPQFVQGVENGLGKAYWSGAPASVQAAIMASAMRAYLAGTEDGWNTRVDDIAFSTVSSPTPPNTSANAATNATTNASSIPTSGSVPPPATTVSRTIHITYTLLLPLSDFTAAQIDMLRKVSDYRYSESAALAPVLAHHVGAELHEQAGMSALVPVIGVARITGVAVINKYFDGVGGVLATKNSRYHFGAREVMELLVGSYKTVAGTVQ